MPVYPGAQQTQKKAPAGPYDGLDEDLIKDLTAMDAYVAAKNAADLQKFTPKGENSCPSISWTLH